MKKEKKKERRKGNWIKNFTRKTPRGDTPPGGRVTGSESQILNEELAKLCSADPKTVA